MSEGLQVDFTISVVAYHGEVHLDYHQILLLE